MTDYTKTVNFAAKDILPTGNPSKLVKGTEIDVEFTAIQTASATKTDKTTLAASGGAALVGANDGSSGSIFTTVQGFITKILSSTGSAIVGFIQAGTGAVATTVQAKLRESVSVLDFIPSTYHAGIAARSNTTDLTAYIQAAIDYVASSEYGGRLYFPRGTYKFTKLQVLYRAQSYLTMIGDGPTSTVLDCYGVDGTYGIIIEGTIDNVLATTIIGTTMSEMSLRGGNAAAGTSGILLQNCQRTLFTRVWVQQFPRHGLVLHRPSGGHHAYTQTQFCVFSGNGNSTADSWGVYTDVSTSDPINDYLDVRSVFTGNGEYSIATPTGGNIKTTATNLVLLSTTLNSSGYGAWLYR